jgi:uncharacterized integral membrane protein
VAPPSNYAERVRNPDLPGGDAGVGDGRPQASKAPGRGAKALVAAVFVILLVVFTIRNSGRVRLDFIVTSGHPRLIWLIIFCTLLGGAVGFFLGRPPRSRRQRSEGPGGDARRRS